MRDHEYYRTMRHSILEEEAGTASDALHEVVQSLGTIAWMVRCTLDAANTGESIPAEMSVGFYKLLDQQCAMLNGISKELEVEERERAVKDEARGVVQQSRVPDEALLDDAHKLRVEFIASNTKAGVDHALIARALNLSSEDIERTVRRLRGETIGHTATQSGKAVGASRRTSLQA